MKDRYSSSSLLHQDCSIYFETIKLTNSETVWKSLSLECITEKKTKNESKEFQSRPWHWSLPLTSWSSMPKGLPERLLLWRGSPWRQLLPVQSWKTQSLTLTRYLPNQAESLQERARKKFPSTLFESKCEPKSPQEKEERFKDYCIAMVLSIEKLDPPPQVQHFLKETAKEPSVLLRQ